MKYYVQAFRNFELHSYDTTVNRCTYFKIYYLVMKRHLFKKDTIIKSFTSEDVNKAFELCEKLNSNN